MNPTPDQTRHRRPQTAEQPGRRLPAARRLTGAALFGLLACPAWAAATECSNEGITRSIEVVYSDPGQAVPCEVIYDKSGEGAGQHSLWRANNEAGYCEAQAAAFLDRLRGLGWSCGTAPAPVENSTASHDSTADERPPTELLGETME